MSTHLKTGSCAANTSPTPVLHYFNSIVQLVYKMLCHLGSSANRDPGHDITFGLSALTNLNSFIWFRFPLSSSGGILADLPLILSQSLQQLLYFNGEPKNTRSYCMISDELGLSALNVLPNVFCTMWGEPHSHRDLWKTCSTYLVTLFVQVTSSYASNNVFFQERKKTCGLARFQENYETFNQVGLMILLNISCQ